MTRYRIHTEHHRQLADTTTPVSIYLKVRDKYPHALLLESSDYHSRENSYSYICCSPLAGFTVEDSKMKIEYPDGANKSVELADRDLVEILDEFVTQFDVAPQNEKFETNGLFGYMSYDAVRYFEDLELTSERHGYKAIPDLMYHLFRFVIVIDHYKNHLHTYRNKIDGIEDNGPSLNELLTLLKNKRVPEYQFSASKTEESNQTDDEYMAMIEAGKHHCRRGDVFQIVLSREFRKKFSGDEFNVYRALRSINPSPYLFYFDYGSHRIFGSSPEAQLTIRDGVARINPIAGTYLRTGDDEEDRKRAEELKNDSKENAEHVMLVDLARNDLSRSAREVKVDTFRDIHFYSHVIHMVSEVSGEVEGDVFVRLAGDTFPAGTLSGAPKYRAMELIDKYEPNSRSFYGGAIGFIGFHGVFNHAITIRSFLSKNNTLIYQAGAGVVVDSDAQSELQEVNNKIAALRGALNLAEEL